MKKASVFLLGLVLIFIAGNSWAFLVVTYSERGLETYSQATFGSDTVEDPKNVITYWMGSFDQAINSYAYKSGGLFNIDIGQASAAASQNTNLSAGAAGFSISGNLAASASWASSGSLASAYAYAKSYVDLLFTNDSPAQYAFTYTDNASPYSLANITMQNLNTSEFVLYGSSLPFSGSIGTGNYEFKLEVLGGESSDFDFSLQVTSAPVPIPAAAWLLGSGLIGLVAVRRRLRKN